MQPETKKQKANARGLSRSVLLRVFILLLLVSCAQAVPIIITIAGEVTSISAQNVPASLTDNIHVGDVFTGIYTYDTSTPDTDASSQIGNYQHSSPYGINVSVGGFDFRTVPSHTNQFVVEIDDNILVNNMRDAYSVVSLANIAIADFPSYSIEWLLFDSTHTALSSTALPETAPVLNSWDWYRFTIGGSEYIQQGDYWRSFYMEGTVTQVSVIPEPSAILLFSVGIPVFRALSA